MLFASSIAVAVLALVQACAYALAVKRKRGSPALSTWITWFVGTSMSVITYLLAKQGGFLSGIRILTDPFVVLIVLTSVLLWGDKTLRFRRFEKWYLLAYGAVALYGLISGDAFQSNLYSQGLIALGYIPTYHKLIKEKRNTEPYTAWILNSIPVLISFLPAIAGHDPLALVYASRSCLQTFLMLALMLYYDRRTRREKAPTSAHP